MCIHIGILEFQDTFKKTPFCFLAVISKHEVQPTPWPLVSEARLRQLHQEVYEFCHLSFDEVTRVLGANGVLEKLQNFQNSKP